jgi:hypothetical protein
LGERRRTGPRCHVVHGSPQISTGEIASIRWRRLRGGRCGRPWARGDAGSESWRGLTDRSRSPGRGARGPVGRRGIHRLTRLSADLRRRNHVDSRSRPRIVTKAIATTPVSIPFPVPISRISSRGPAPWGAPPLIVHRAISRLIRASALRIPPRRGGRSTTQWRPKVAWGWRGRPVASGWGRVITASGRLI